MVPVFYGRGGDLPIWAECVLILVIVFMTIIIIDILRTR